MADGLSFNLSGADKTIQAIGNVPGRVAFLILQAEEHAARNTLEDAVLMCPVDTGDLKNSAHMGVTELLAFVTFGDGQSDKTYSYADGYEADGYAWFQELGTTKMAAQPYLGPAFEENSQKLLDELLQIMS